MRRVFSSVGPYRRQLCNNEGGYFSGLLSTLQRAFSILRGTCIYTSLSLTNIYQALVESCADTMGSRTVIISVLLGLPGKADKDPSRQNK